MATKLVTPRKNNFQVSGLIVKNDAFINNAGTVAHFRIAACSSGPDSPSCFFDCVQFAKEGKPIDASILKKGTKVLIEGYFHMNAGRPAADGTPAQPRMELVITTIGENKPVEVEVAEDEAAGQAAPAPGIEDAPEPSLYDDLPENL